MASRRSSRERELEPEFEWKVSLAGGGKTSIRVRRYGGEPTPPEGWHVSITASRLAIIEGNLLAEIKSMGSGSKENIIKAACKLEEQLGGLASRPACLHAVKDICKQTHKNVYRMPIAIRFWVRKKDMQLVLLQRDISIHDSTVDRHKRPRVESTIEWPSSYPESAAAELDGDAMPPMPARSENRPPATVIQPPKQNAPLPPHMKHRGVRRG